MNDTQGVDPGRGGGRGAGLGEYAGKICKNVEFCTKYSRNEPAAPRARRPPCVALLSSKCNEFAT
eukprot:4791538-Prymnesium_polylepis.1